MKKFLFLIFLFLGIYFAARVLLVWDRPNSDSDARVSFMIPKGTSLNSIVNLLEEKELIQDAFVFKLFVKHQKLAQKLQAGEYIIQRNLTFAEIAQILQKGRSKEMKVTIPEGSTIDQIDDILTRLGLSEAGEFKKCVMQCDFSFEVSSLEGYLFPSTYYVNLANHTNKNFIQRLYRTFQQQLGDMKKDIPANRTLEEIVIVASMIEREANVVSEMADISDVIWKRLDKPMVLGIDATTRYEKNDWKNPLYTADFEVNSPYNTRKRQGLPPTAISNPGIEALRAAIYPSSNPYYYYLHDRNGVVHFGKTLEEHNANKRQYLW